MRIGLGLGLNRVAQGRAAAALDTLSVTAAAAYGFFRLRAAFAGSAIRVRRSSDNAELDIGFTGTAIDFSASGPIAVFCGTTAGNHGYVTRWYDQSGNGYDSVQATAARQPQVWRDGAAVTQSGRAIIGFDAAGTQLVAPIPALGSSVCFAYVTGTAIDFSPGHRIAATGVTAPEFGHAAWLVFPAALSSGDKASLAAAFGTSSSGDWDLVIAQRGGTAAALTLTTAGGVATTIDWGDGTVNTPASGVLQSRTYASAATAYQIRAKSSSPITQLVSASNVFAFDLAALPGTLIAVNLSGSNPVSGSVASLPAGLTNLYITGANIIGGSVANLPAGLTSLYAFGSNTLTGSLNTLPTGLSAFNVAGANTISGSTAALPSALSLFVLQGNNSVATSTTPWRTAAISNVVLAGGALSSASVDNLLVALANVTSWAGVRTIDLRGNNAARTAASNAAVATITGLGATVLTN